MPLIPPTMNPLTSSSTDTNSTSPSATHERGAQSPPPEEQSEAQVGKTGSGKQSKDQTMGQPTKEARTLKETAGKDQIRTGGEEKDYGTERLGSNVDGPLKGWSEDIKKRPQDWSAPGGSN